MGTARSAALRGFVAAAVATSVSRGRDRVGDADSGNTVTRNSGPGINFSPVINRTGLVFTGNNIYANGLQPVASFPLASNCGVWLGPGETIVAERNFWGAPTGPGADPADAVCGGGQVDVIPVATRPFTTHNTAGR